MFVLLNRAIFFFLCDSSHFFEINKKFFAPKQTTSMRKHFANFAKLQQVRRCDYLHYYAMITNYI